MFSNNIITITIVVTRIKFKFANIKYHSYFTTIGTKKWSFFVEGLYLGRLSGNLLAWPNLTRAHTTFWVTA